MRAGINAGREIVDRRLHFFEIGAHVDDLTLPLLKGAARLHFREDVKDDATVPAVTFVILRGGPGVHI